MKLFNIIALAALLAFGSGLFNQAEAAVSVIKASHFEGGKNMTAGNKQDKNSKDLAALVIELQGAVNTNEAAIAKIVKYTAAATAGGGATQVVAVTGLAAADSILSVTQRVKGANSLPLLGWQAQGLNTLTLVYSADPGAGAIVEVLVKKP